MPTRSPEIITRASQLDEDLVPEPWDARDADSDRSLVAERERYRLQGVTDGQGAGIVPAYALDVADTGSVPQNTKDGWTRGSAGRVLGPDGKYVSKASDVPRKSFDGEDPGLLVEAASRTNHVAYSSAINKTNWYTSGSSFTETAVASILSGETAYSQKSDTDENDNLGQSADTFSAGEETVKFIIEQDTASLVLFTVRDRSAGTNIEVFDYDFSTDTASLVSNDAGLELNTRILTSSGPNGGRVAEIVLQYDPTNTTGGNVSGSSRGVQIFPDRDGNLGATILHHAQIEEAPNASSPIVTGSSAKTRSGEFYSIPVGDWQNPNQGTFFISVVPFAYESGNYSDIIKGTNSGGRIEFHLSSPFKVLATNTATNPNINDNCPAFRISKIALSLTGSEMRLSVNGASDVQSGDNGLRNENTQYTLGESMSKLYRRIVYYPRALPESTLNTLTS